MRKYLFLLLIPTLCFATQYTHVDYVTGNSITAAGQNANENGIGTIINGNLDTGNLSASAGIVGTQLANGTITTTQISPTAGITGGQIANGTITNTQVASGGLSGTNIALSPGGVYGTSANSGGAAGTINQGSVSTPDLRANAVTISSFSSSGGAGGNGSGTKVDYVTITTIGGTVFITGSAEVTITAGGAGYLADIWASTSTQVMPGCVNEGGSTTPTSGNVSTAVSYTCLTSLAAGTYTFSQFVGANNGSYSSTPKHMMSVIELRD